MLANIAAQWRIEHDPETKRQERETGLAAINARNVEAAQTAERDDDRENTRQNVYQQIMQDQQEMELQQWQQSSHTYAGQTMTGKEWGDLAAELKKDGPLRDWLMEKMMADGKSKEEAKKMTDQVALLAQMQSMPKSHWTPEMKALDEEMEAHPALKKELKAYVAEGNEHKAATLNLGNTSGRNTAKLTSTTKEVSVSAGADVLNEGSPPANEPTIIVAPAMASNITSILLERSTVAKKDFPNAPDLTTHHRAAVAAHEPLEAKPLQVAAVPQPAAAAGLDV